MQFSYYVRYRKNPQYLFRSCFQYLEEVYPNLDEIKEARFKIPSLEHDKKYKFKSDKSENVI